MEVNIVNFGSYEFFRPGIFDGSISSEYLSGMVECNEIVGFEGKNNRVD
jgi:hypothetical protein